MPLKLRTRNGWTMRRLMMGVLLCIIGVIATRDAWLDILHATLRVDGVSYTILVPIAAAWLAWVRIGRVRHCRVRETWVGPMIVAAGWLIYFAAEKFSWQSVWQAGAVLVLIGCFVSVAGKQLLLNLLPAFVVLFFVVPVPPWMRQQIALPLQTLTAKITQQMFVIGGMMIERSGNLLSISNGPDVAMIRARGGLRLIFAMMLVSYTFAFSTPLRGFVRALLIIISPLLAIVCNIARLLLAVWIYGYFSPASADRFHNFSGWAMLLISFFILVGMIRFLRWATIPVSRYMLAYD
jgi:exosortase